MYITKRTNKRNINETNTKKKWTLKEQERQTGKNSKNNVEYMFVRIKKY